MQTGRRKEEEAEARRRKEEEGEARRSKEEEGGTESVERKTEHE